jgi:DNA invertase Pin-like site-specific DNA recombinase
LDRSYHRDAGRKRGPTGGPQRGVLDTCGRVEVTVVVRQQTEPPGRANAQAALTRTPFELEREAMATRNSILIPAVGYLRRSTDLQERSIPDQKAYIEKWAAEHGYRIVRWYIDDAISGTSTKGRNDFDRMIDAAENGRDFETILCYDISRFSRGGTNETGYYLHRLKLVGVNVLFPADSIPEGDEGELIQGVKSWQARQYSVKLARDTIRGQISNIRERKSAPGGVAPYGYDKQHLTSDGKLLRTLRWMPDGSKQEFDSSGKLLRVIEPGVNIKKAKSDIIRYVLSTPDRVAVMKRIFDLCVQGYGFHSIAQTLNNEGIPSPAGQKWNTARVAKLIRNPVYRGAIAWNRHTMGSLFGLDGDGKLRPKKQKGWRKNDVSDWIISEDVHEPIVSLETWNAAQHAPRRRRQGSADQTHAAGQPFGLQTLRPQLHHDPRPPLARSNG